MVIGCRCEEYSKKTGRRGGPSLSACAVINGSGRQVLRQDRGAAAAVQVHAVIGGPLQVPLSQAAFSMYDTLLPAEKPGRPWR